MKIIPRLLAAIAGLYLLHRLALWAEQRGWIFYLRKKPDPASLGTALLQLQQVAEPQKRHVMELKRARRVEHEDKAGPDEPHGRPPGSRRE